MTKEEALDRLRYRCSRSEYCSGQVAETLRRWILSAKLKSSEELPASGKSANWQPQLCEADIPEILSILVSEKFIDDKRFAEAFVRDKLKFNGWGRVKIHYKLKSFGVAQDVIQTALEINYDREDDDALSGYHVLEKLIEKKWNSLKKEESCQMRKAKVIRFALGRGFEYDAIIRALDKIKG